MHLELYSFDLRYMIAIGYSNGANIASSLLLLRPEVKSSADLVRAMVAFIPEKVPNLTTKNIFMGAGEYDPMSPRNRLICFTTHTKSLCNHIITMGRKFWS